jgi:hypothetical protein
MPADRAWEEISSAPVVFLGEFHALDTASRSAAALLRDWSRQRIPSALAVEFVHARHQRALDAYLSGLIGEREFQRRVRYREEWGYPWSGPRELLRTARSLGVPVIGLDLSPRGSAADLGRRDRIAAERLAVRAGSDASAARLAVVIGEAHLHSGHLPRELAARWPAGRAAARVLHDLERLDGVGGEGWAAAEGGWWHRRRRPPRARLPALARVYRRWAEDPMAPSEIDVGLMADGLIEAELRVVGIDARRRRLGPGRWLPDVFPETYAVEEPRRAARRLREEGWGRARVRRALAEARERGALLVPEAGVLLVAGASLGGMARETGRFAASALRPGSPRSNGATLWQQLSLEALAFVLARAMDPRLPAASPREVVVAARRPHRLAWELGSWLGDGLDGARARGDLSTRTLRRWLTQRLEGADAAVRWLRRAVRCLDREKAGGTASG